MSKQDFITVNYEGIDIEVAKDIADDALVIDMMDQINEGNELRVVGLVKYIVGKDKFYEIADALTKKHGKMNSEHLAELTTTVFEALDPKDSASQESNKTTQTS